MFLSLVIFLPDKNLWMGDGYTQRALFAQFTFYDILWLKDGYFLIHPIAVISSFLLGLKTVSYLSGLIWAYYVFKLSEIDLKWSILFVAPFIFIFAGHMEVYGPVYASIAAFTYYWITDSPKLRKVIWIVWFSHFVISTPFVMMYLIDKWNNKNDSYEWWIDFWGKIYVFGLYFIFMLVMPDRPSGMELFGVYGIISAPHILEVVLIGGYILSWLFLNVQPLKVVLKEYNLFSTPEVIGSIVGLGLFCTIIPHLGLFRDLDLFMMLLFPIVMLYITLSEISWKQYIIAFITTFTLMAFNTTNPQATMASYINVMPNYGKEYMDGRVNRATQIIYINELNDRIMVDKLKERLNDNKGAN